MNEKFVPKVNCRFKIRQDIDGYIGFFQIKGVLTFNEVGAFIVSQMTGDKNIQEIGKLVGDNFPKMKNPAGEVVSIAKQLQDSGFF